MTQDELEDISSVSHMTFIRIRAGGTIMAGTKQKLAQALQCSTGDLQAAISEQPNPLREEADQEEGYHKQPSVMATVDRLEAMVKEEHPDLAAEPAKENWIERGRGKGEWPDPEEPKPEPKIPVKQEAVAQAVMAETEAYDEAEPGAMPGKEVLEALFPDEEPEVKVLRENCKLIMQASRAARRSCREELKSMFLKAATQMVLGEDQLCDLYSDFGYAVVKWLAEEETADAQKGEET